MRILLTGITSFTGVWFAQALISNGHDVVAAIRGPQDGYHDLRTERLKMVEGKCAFVWSAPFGSDTFISTIEREGPFDMLCHHAAHMTDYRSSDFDALGAAAANSHNIVKVLMELAKRKCRRVVLTGSVFEAEEGAGERPLRAFSPYGLSKTMTAQIFRYYVSRAGMALGKFVIPNPFGPLEDPRFTDYLLRCWSAGNLATVNTPTYVRDNIPISLLALAYARFAAELPEIGFHTLNPSFYVESQGAFALRFAREIGARLQIDCPISLAQQAEFSEPRVRINTDLLSADTLGWSEVSAWDALADYYARHFGLRRSCR